MQKFLYITDQDEYTEHSFIGPLFEKYLNKHFDINVIYFSKQKSDFERKDDTKFIIPHKYKEEVLSQLESNGISVDDYAYITVRNDISILKSILKEKIKHNYKVGFRLSFPKRMAKLQIDEANNKKNYFDIINNKIKTFQESSLINDCDIFLPTSRQMRDDYLKSVKTRSFVIPSAIDPDMMQKNVHHEGVEKRFFYAGTLDKLREFETVLKAFSKIDNKKFKLMVSTKDPEYAQELFAKYPQLDNSIEVYDAKTKKELLAVIAKADIGLAALPSIELFNSSTPMKILDYYSSAIPCVMTDNENNRSIFSDNASAWMTDFTEDAIKEKLEHIINLTKDEITLVGENGQKRLLDVRNYERIAADLAHQLNIL